MKKLAIVLALIPVLGWSQVKSGVSYSQHPAYDVVTAMHQVWESGTEAELRAIYAEDAKIWDPGAEEAIDIDREAKGMNWWHENFSDITITTMKGATPDIIKYKDDKEGVWDEACVNECLALHLDRMRQLYAELTIALCSASLLAETTVHI